jgi:hypothetical protein
MLDDGTESIGIGGGGVEDVTWAIGRFSEAELDFALNIARLHPRADDMHVINLSIYSLPLILEAKRRSRLGQQFDLQSIVTWADYDRGCARLFKRLTELELGFVFSIVDSIIDAWKNSQLN